MQNLIVSCLVMVVSAILVAGSYLLSEDRLDERVAGHIADTLGTDQTVSVTIDKKVNNDYGICGRYTLPSGEGNAFFYNEVNGHMALKKDTERYRVNCLDA
ncbi:hypothetical protein [Modicisalibacter tunisiensis]|uniref:Uncharacterized protein n=1 Tax=Modicisalibacter tunisiensis TaxID=390637 RepID=A0ABS7WWG9_9GAMM|nr:hypothetical protein [Modicisalibacter tunisiensis]MBZ9539656.1 hypothetical protein [Modicisalibacter tunisiensis]MBZ9566956.1 hypothetical protein [Modicisalibacter tunisiensis]